MPCTLSTQKRAHLAHQAAPAAATPSWSTSLPQDITIKLAERIVDDNDIDSYMAFRAVCHSWRTETTDKPGKVNDHTDPTRFQPTKWALLNKQEDHVTFLDVDAGRFLHMSIPILCNYLFIGATSGGLILLGEKQEPHQACLLNPFTGAIAHFKVRAPAEGVMVVAVTTKPLMVFVSLEDGDIIWADQSSENFKRFNRLESDKPTPIVAFNDDVYASDPHGVIFTSNVDDVPNGKKCRSAAIIYMGVTIPSHNHNASPDASPDALAGGGGRYYLVQSGGDLLLVTRPLDGAANEPLVRRVDTKQNVLEPVSSIGSRAIFVSHVRCISIDADKFQGIKGGCIHFVEPVILAQDDYAPSTITTYRVAPGPQAGLIMFEQGILEGCFRPFTITQVFADYCRSVHYHELYQMIFSDWDWDFSNSESDETSSYGSDYEALFWELEEEAEFLGINYEAE
ncbi:hypothetical protein BDA96_02G066900 [Sorghum bicolor]|uniref:KIB1-4 beta-propeller domain-containing protein n=1 Tax=Sorghum bicolor TaxID=4558 RepID=A0A921USW9_SORBI|nr:hypothetical protein BDA96_02G066900 [Sorghum bicolor]